MAEIKIDLEITDGMREVMGVNEAGFMDQLAFIEQLALVARYPGDTLEAKVSAYLNERRKAAGVYREERRSIERMWKKD